MEQIGSHWTCFMEFGFLFFSKADEKIQVSLKSVKINDTLSEEK
jgi:hypothetical protein